MTKKKRKSFEEMCADALQAAKSQKKRSDYKITDEHVSEMGQSMIDKGYLPHNMEAFETLSRYMAWRKYGEVKRGLLLTGTCGTGKTLWVKLFGQCSFITTKTLINRYKNNRDWFDDTIQPPRYDVVPANYYHLAIDEVGDDDIVKDYGEKRDVISEVISRRYNLWQGRKGYITHFTSNLDMAQLKERYDERIVSRLTEMCNIIEMKGKDLRAVR